MGKRNGYISNCRARHCELRSSEAIQEKHSVHLDCFGLRPRNDGCDNLCLWLFIALLFLCVGCEKSDDPVDEPEIPVLETGITPDLVVPDPSPEAVELYGFLKENFGKKVISGTVANVSWNINEAEWVYQHTGKYPALNAFDYIFLYASPANWIDYGDTEVVENWHKANGIVSCMWHWNVPKRAGSAGNDYSFYTEETDFDIREALKSGTRENTLILADLEKIANYLLLLKNKNIPILWRPLHEAKGNYGRYPGGTAWFWWGAKGAGPFKNLWRLMFNYFKDKGLNNLIWVWTSESGDDDWYPGDEYVDIIGRDMYNQQSVDAMLLEYKNLEQRFPRKIVTLGECGNVAGIDEQLNAGANWSWFMTWYDYDRTVTPGSAAFQSETHQHGNAAFWRNAFATGKVLSREELKKIKDLKI